MWGSTVGYPSDSMASCFSHCSRIWDDLLELSASACPLRCFTYMTTVGTKGLMTALITRKVSSVLTNGSIWAAAKWRQTSIGRFSGTGSTTARPFIVIRTTSTFTLAHLGRRVAKTRLPLLCSWCAANNQNKLKQNVQHWRHDAVTVGPLIIENNWNLQV